jgi:hypothetical protein
MPVEYLLPAGEIRRRPRREMVELDDRQRALDTLAQLAPSEALLARRHLQRERDVLEDVHVRPDRIRLEDHPDPAFVRGHAHALLGREERPSVERDLARVGRLQPGDRAQRRRLPASGRSEQRDELALRDLERQVVDGEHAADALPAAGRKRLRQPQDREHRVMPPSRRYGRRSCTRS